ncbi:DNA-directed primase/polymerase protein-like [Cephus cinctus]|uniref:DNA-directed primase/polymerase protein n=1 Tax=Cephus cinctus TaxID=211228 RepID=A0AAJ7BRV0_CEPCN|nr:DNA-directed primase/polymerase protein-like [Cephus cinctus]
MEAIETQSFYGDTLAVWRSKIFQELQHGILLSVKEPHKMPQRIMGPTQFWAEFHKQAEALAVARQHDNSNDVLGTFVYQNENGHRIFVVAHPEVYWWYYSQKSPECRCSYEVIPDGAPVKLYFDLEFLIDQNPNHNGHRMTKTITEIFCAYLTKLWGCPCNESNVLSLDSTTREKFSRHLIFCIKEVAFKNNIQAGKFVKSVCKDITNYVDSGFKGSDVLDFFDRKNLKELFIKTSENRKLFIDTSVYSRNRHFRIYKSTKWGKQSHLVLSPHSKYISAEECKDKDLGIFLDSLISYFPTKTNLILLELDEKNVTDIEMYIKRSSQLTPPQESTVKSKYPCVDKFISNIVKPGRIRLSTYFESTKKISYEIIGNRYCDNIGRPHKSNNIYLIVDLHKKLWYQKCHDEDCTGFMSKPKKLPEEIAFQLEDESDEILSSIDNFDLPFTNE